VLELFGYFVLVYFALLNAIYIAFTLYVAWALPRRLRTDAFAGEEEIFASPLSPGISILVPAFNEEAGIVESVNSFRRLRWPKLEVIVVSDGSTDGTVDRLREAMDLVPVRLAVRDAVAHKPLRETYVSRLDPSVLVIDKENGGKADAQNAGANMARYDYVCVVDSDSVLEENALLRVAKPVLDDPGVVVATGGIIRIANGCRVENGHVVEIGLPRSGVAVMQVIEYFRAFLVGRVSWSRLRALLIISGAFGLFRRDAVTAAGGWWADTVGEDAELVIRMHHHLRERGEDYSVEFVPDPVSWTEAPETLSVLARQRRRWQRGLWESLARHRRMIFNPRYGTVGTLAMPYFLIFELLGPLVEVLGLVALPIAVALDLLAVDFLVVFLMLSIGVGVLLSFGALSLEEFSYRRHTRNRDIVRLLAYAVAENFGYRQLTSFWRLMGLVDVARGETTWGVMPRKGLGTG
jgi:cellulose synthase/poly-beta-1,6-N-acetylglucosamine synthase-like glycosyltransferase